MSLWAITFWKGAPDWLVIDWHLISDVNIWSKFESSAKRLLKSPITGKKKKKKNAGYICTSKLSHARTCFKYCNCMYFSVGSMLSGTYSAWFNHQSLKQSFGTIMEFETTPGLSGTLFGKVGGNNSDSGFFAPVRFNASKHSLALFYLVLQMLPQEPDITVPLLTILSTETTVTALECAHNFV